MKLFRHIVLSTCLLLVSFSVAHAQFDLSAFGDVQSIDALTNTASFGGAFSGLTLSAAPSFPDPYADFEVTLSAPSQNYAGALIKWYVDGEEEIAARNARKHTFTAKGIGEATTIKTVIERMDGVVDEKTLTINPVQIDIVIEGHTVVPHFYEGRPLPSMKASARATAIINTGYSIDRENLSYEWKINTSPLSGGGIRGLMGVNFEMPLKKKSFIGVTIKDASGILGQKTIPVEVAEPEVIFYEDNQLRGTLKQALDADYQVSGNQLVVRAVPYYMSPFLNNPDYILEWSLNGQRVDNEGAEEPNTLVLTSSGNSTASLGIQLANKAAFGQAVSGGTRIKFGN